jgi:hypothetical protein
MHPCNNVFLRLAKHFPPCEAVFTSDKDAMQPNKDAKQVCILAGQVCELV